MLGYTYWLHIGDLLTFCDGNMTAGQYFVASRVLDIEMIENKQIPYWQNYMSELVYGTPKDTFANIKFVNLINSLNQRGLNPNIESLSISDSPIVLNNGTHRIAWCALNMSNAYLPCRQIKKDLLPWFPIQGRKFWKDSGLSETELKVLEERYETIISLEVRTWITAYIKAEYFAEFTIIIKDYGTIRKSLNISLDNHDCYVVTINLKKQKLYASRNKIKSYYVDEVEEKMKQYPAWGRIAHTVTESVEIENFIELEIHSSIIEKQG